MAYKAVVTVVTPYKHPNADRLKIARMQTGEQVIIGGGIEDGTLGVFFPVDGRLSKQFMEANDLIARYDENKVKIAESGYFDDKGKIRIQKIRGVRSDGFWIPLTAFDYISPELKTTFTQGQLIDTITYNGVQYPICEKYFTKATQELRNKQKYSVVKPVEFDVRFPEHKDTANIRHYIDMLQVGDLCTVTRKLHGTSERDSYLYTQKHTQVPRNWFEHCKKFLGLPVQYKQVSTWEWMRLWGSKTVALFGPEFDGKGYYGSNEFRYKALKDVKLYKGEIIYSEIVGYINDTRLIMNMQSVPSEMPEVKKSFGSSISYTYGCEPGQLDVYVYRITQTNADGVIFELPWDQVKMRCAELGLKHVPEVERFIYDGDRDKLIAHLDRLVNGATGDEAVPDTIDPRHPQEGVVIRVDNLLGTSFYKMKSVAFLALEGHAKALETYIDLEEVS